MLKRFEVQGFKSFLHPVTIDFSDVRDYQFNNTCVKDGLLNKITFTGEIPLARPPGTGTL